MARNELNKIRSVNGPPGTGKTTLLKDIFADLIVRAAKEIVDLESKTIKGEVTYFKQGKVGKLPDNISENNIVVASSNNGAVQNIVNELPLTKELFEDFKPGLFEIDYFKDIMNQGKKTKKKEENQKEEKQEDKFWGLFSLEGGRSDNCKILIEKIRSIINFLKDKEFQGDETIYDKFEDKYREVKSIIDDTQFYSEYVKQNGQVEYDLKNIEQWIDNRTKIKKLKEEITMRWVEGVHL